ncbi:invasion associated locus B family protein [Halocynthiibacter sp.]|uniref:invasion associated locus B family protein n=1 Tax=Halocynthiibacter sp. TaxID=1979210 RepID=UPI003C64881D
MKSLFSRKSIGAICLAMLTASGVWAQETTENRVAVQTAWSVFIDDDPTQCWAVSGPEDTVNTDSDGRPKAVRRGRIQMFVTWNPASSVAGQVSFAGGYPFASGSTVQIAIGENTYELFTSGENAWAASPGDDAKIVTAMKRGATALLTGRSGRGTVTKDTFSLLGFTAAVEEAETRCGG